MLVEAFAPTIGLSFNPDGCGYSGTRQMQGTFKVLKKTGSVQEAAHATACDLVTLDSEFFKLKTIIPYSYRVLENGAWENGGRTLEEINDPELAAGERIKRVIEVQNAMANNPKLIQAAVANEDFGSGRNYLYLFTKDPNDKSKINALAIEHQGNQDELNSFLRLLAPSADNSSVSFDKPLFFNWQNQVLLTDVFEAVLDSYKDPTRREEMKPYLTRLAHDTADFPKLLEEHTQKVAELTRKFQEEILSKENEVAGLSAMVHGINKTVESWIARDRERYQARLGINIERAPGIYIKTPKTRERVGTLREIGFDTSSREMAQVNSNGSPENVFLTGKKAIEKVFEPVVPVIIGIINKLAAKAEGDEKTLEGEKVEEGKEKTAESREKNKNRKEEIKAWQKIIEILFKPILKEEQEAKLENDSFADITLAEDEKGVWLSDSKVIYPTDMNLYAIKHSEGSQFVPNAVEGDSFQVRELENLRIMSIGEMLTIFLEGKEEKEKIKGSLQLILEILLANDTDDESIPSKEDPTQFMRKPDFERLSGQNKVEQGTTINLITLAQAIAQKEENSHLSLLLEIYDRLDQKEEIKEFIMALIYCQLKQTIPRVSMEISAEEEDVLKGKVVFLRKKLMQFLRFPLDSTCEVNKELLFLLYGLTLAILDLSQIEILPLINLFTSFADSKDKGAHDDRSWLIERLNNLGQNPFGKKSSQKRRKKLPLYTTLFFYQVVYQYQPLVIKAQNMTQYRQGFILKSIKIHPGGGII